MMEKGCLVEDLSMLPEPEGRSLTSIKINSKRSVDPESIRNFWSTYGEKSELVILPNIFCLHRSWRPLHKKIDTVVAFLPKTKSFIKAKGRVKLFNVDPNW